MNCIIFIAAFFISAQALAQVTNMPLNVQTRLAEVAPGWGKNILGNMERTLEVYTPILASAPKDGVQVSRDIAYGPAPRHRLDIYRVEGLRNAPIVVFFHAGAYVRGERNINNEVYGNVATYFARNGMLGLNATYRLAPEAKWPAAAEDVASVVSWLKATASNYGGDSNRIYLIGHSAGATHVATYVFLKSLQPPQGHGVAGVVLMSGRYHFDPSPDDPNLKNFQAYFGIDASQYPARSPVNHVKAMAPLPTFIMIAEYDNPDLDTQGARLFQALCERDRACPRFSRLTRHNHFSMVYQFNTPDEAPGREVLEFIKRGR